MHAQQTHSISRRVEVQWWQEVRCIMFCLITATNIGQISKSGLVSESACLTMGPVSHIFKS